MARNDDQKYESYPKDSFDNPPSGPVGVHNGRRSWAVRLMPYLIVIVIAALVGVLFWGVYSGEAANLFKRNASQSASATTSASTSTSASASSSSSSASTSASQSASSTPSESSASPSQSASASESTQDTSTVNLNTSISVINGTSTTGYAAQEAQRLQSAGFTNVAASNPNNMQLPAQSVVWYQNDADLATAQQVAQTLNISSVVKATGISVPVAVVLMS
ncbi:LytR C-terminal domain-containing protein [Bifidobacterium canis]|uniref:Cell wall integrity and stress response protein 1 n=1 Tax=Bifidobacterium canis TaxID=2610880 RepID=A0A7K1J5J1_9BIFI|nr:LytR C-terminal domain-containing protein [Bifidobacterium canis]MUH59730.1 cell wall integrity and stress response protein 1 [Bifidobacterium canis]